MALKKILLAGIIAISITFSINQIIISKTVLNDAFFACCNANLCDTFNCNSPTTVQLKSNGCPSQDIDINCMQCIDYLRSSNVCNWESIPYVFCWYNGLRYSSYYELEEPLWVYLDGPESLEYNTNGYFYACAYDGGREYEYSWRLYYPCEEKLIDSKDSNIDSFPCGSWQTLGCTDPELVRSDTRNFWLKCIVTDRHSDVATSNTLQVTIE